MPYDADETIVYNSKTGRWETMTGKPVNMPPAMTAKQTASAAASAAGSAANAVVAALGGNNKAESASEKSKSKAAGNLSLPQKPLGMDIPKLTQTPTSTKTPGRQTNNPLLKDFAAKDFSVKSDIRASIYDDPTEVGLAKMAHENYLTMEQIDKGIGDLKEYVKDNKPQRSYGILSHPEKLPYYSLESDAKKLENEYNAERRALERERQAILAAITHESNPYAEQFKPHGTTYVESLSDEGELESVRERNREQHDLYYWNQNLDGQINTLNAALSYYNTRNLEFAANGEQGYYDTSGLVAQIDDLKLQKDKNLKQMTQNHVDTALTDLSYGAIRDPDYQAHVTSGKKTISADEAYRLVPDENGRIEIPNIVEFTFQNPDWQPHSSVIINPVREEYLYLSAEERQVYAALLGAGKKEQAARFLELLERPLNARRQLAQNENLARYCDEHPIAATMINISSALERTVDAH